MCIVNDAFGAAHRAHASTEGVAQVMKSQGQARQLRDTCCKRKSNFSAAQLATRNVHSSPFSAERRSRTKSRSLKICCTNVDSLLVGGGMAYTFYKAAGHEIGKSLLDKDSIEFCKSLLCDDKIILPVDCVVAPDFDNDAPRTTVRVTAIPADQEGLDIGPETIAQFAEIIKKAQDRHLERPHGRL